MVWIPAGTFMMGRYPGEQDSYYSQEDPQHQVTLSAAFWMGKYEVTQAQWKAVMNELNPSVFQGDNRDNCPVEAVGWEEVQSFIVALSGQTGKTFRLPTEAEWEYACRAGTTTRFYWGDDPTYTLLGNYIWYTNWTTYVSPNHPCEVGTKLPNSWGLYDMSGNVWEWCQDWYGEYVSIPVTDPTGPVTGSFHVYRGGSWYDRGDLCRSAVRYNYASSLMGDSIGFRIVRYDE
jgi:formylglycine-generating enzyme required for sulfatase activity